MTSDPDTPPSPPVSFAETQVLIEGACQGDERALAALFTRYYPRTRAIVALRLGTTARKFIDHEDIVQDTLLNAFRSLRDEAVSCRSEGAFLNWLATIAQNNVADRIRRARRDKRGQGGELRFASVGTTALSAALQGQGAPSPSQEAAGLELEERLEEALLALDDRSRQVIELRRLCGMTHEEIAEAMGLGAASSARALLARARAKLAERLRDRSQ